MMRLFYILLFLPLFGLSQHETTIYKNTFYCFGSCLDQCDSVKIYVELFQWNDFEGGYFHVNLDPDNDTIFNVRNLDIKKMYCGDDYIYFIPWKNEWGVKKVQIDSDGVSIKHKHNLFYRHWFIYHSP